eukprot:6793075-Pyramimonas_sp.AAC.1
MLKVIVIVDHALFNPLQKASSVSASPQRVHDSFAAPGNELRDKANARIRSMTAWQPKCVSRDYRSLAWTGV